MDKEQFTEKQKMDDIGKGAGGYAPVGTTNDTYEFNTIIEEQESMEEGIFDIDDSQDGLDVEKGKYSEENILGI
jgi:hypothetical protein